MVDDIRRDEVWLTIHNNYSVMKSRIDQCEYRIAHEIGAKFNFVMGKVDSKLEIDEFERVCQILQDQLKEIDEVKQNVQEQQTAVQIITSKITNLELLPVMQRSAARQQSSKMLSSPQQPMYSNDKSSPLLTSFSRKKENKHEIKKNF